MNKEPEACPYCSAKAKISESEGLVLYSYACTAEVVVSEKSRRVIKTCPSVEGRGHFT